MNATLKLSYPDPVGAARLIAPDVDAEAAETDADGAFPARSILAMRAAGLLAAPLPASLGGTLSATDAASADLLCRTLRTVGYASLPLGRLYEGHVNALALIARYGTPGQIARLAADVQAGHLFGVWNTESADGLRLSPDGRRLEGRKIFASGAGFVTRPLVTARTGSGEVRMVVPRLLAGAHADLSAWRAHGMRASATGTVDLSGVGVTAEDRIGQPGDYLRQPFFSVGAWRFAAVQQGGIERLFDELRRHLAATGRGGDPHQLARLGTAAIAVETARLWVECAASRAAAAEADPAAAIAYVNLTRLAVERAGLDVLELTQRSIGLAGFLRSHPVERLSRDLATYLRQPAPDKALTDAAAQILSCPAAGLGQPVTHARG